MEPLPGKRAASISGSNERAKHVARTHGLSDRIREDEQGCLKCAIDSIEFPLAVLADELVERCKGGDVEIVSQSERARPNGVSQRGPQTSPLEMRTVTGQPSNAWLAPKRTGQFSTAVYHVEANEYAPLESGSIDGGFCVFVPALPEIATQGDTEIEAMENAEDAIREPLRFRHERGMEIPLSDTAEVRQIVISVPAA